MLRLHFMLILLLTQFQCGAKPLALAKAEDPKRLPEAGRDRAQVPNSGDLGAHCKKWHRDTPGCGVQPFQYQIWQPCSLSAKVSLVGDPWKCKDASIHITQLKELDTNVYFCHVCMKTKDSDTKTWQALKETNLTVTASALEPPVRLQGLLVGGVISAVALALGLGLGLGLGMFIAWRKGSFPKCSRPSRRRSPGVPSQQEQRGDSRADAPLSGAPALPGRPAEAAQPGLLYAALALPGDPEKMPPARNPRAATKRCCCRQATQIKGCVAVERSVLFPTWDQRQPTPGVDRSRARGKAGPGGGAVASANKNGARGRCSSQISAVGRCGLCPALLAMRVKFAPLRLPLQRRLQTAAVLQWVFSFLALAQCCLALFLLLLLGDGWALAVLYAAWLYLDWDTPSRGGRRSAWVRSWAVWRSFRDYFPITLVKTADLDPSRNYLFGFHPHGVLVAGAFGNFCTEATGFTELFPGLTPHLLMLPFWFRVPFFRDYIMSGGLVSSDKASAAYLLSHKGRGQVAVIAVGGPPESLEARPGAFTLQLLNRKGFIKMALQHGAALVPVFSFGENELFHQVPNPQGSFLRRVQEWLQKVMGLALPLFHARGVFQYNFGLLPFRRPIHTLVGAPILVPETPHPSREAIDELHVTYLEKLNQLFEENKAKYGVPQDKHLHLI